MVSVGWALASGFAVPPPEFFILQGLATAVLGAIALAYRFVRRDPKLVRLLVNIILGFWFGGFAILFSYLCATTNRPLVDAGLAAIDRGLGFDWPAMVSWAASQPWLTEWARFIYDRPLSELGIIIVILAILGRPDRVEEFVSCFMISGVVTAAVGALLPADSGYAYFQVPREVYTALNAMVTPEYLDHFHALRSGELRHLVVGDVRGLVAFPSFHTAFALLLCYAVRGLKLLFYPILALNLAVVATTPFVGAHYVADVIGGLMVVALAISIVRLISREPLGAASRASTAQPVSA
jgi:membrane-associated phospholipid phosphatase